MSISFNHETLLGLPSILPLSRSAWSWWSISGPREWSEKLEPAVQPVDELISPSCLAHSSIEQKGDVINYCSY